MGQVVLERDWYNDTVRVRYEIQKAIHREFNLMKDENNRLRQQSVKDKEQRRQMLAAGRRKK